MLVLVIGDLYIPEREIVIPEQFIKLLQPRGKIDTVLCLGNVSTSPESETFLQNLSSEYHCVRGESDDTVLESSMVFQFEGLKVAMTNGYQIVPHNDPLAQLQVARMMDVDVLLCGSTHQVEAYILEGKFFVNPGSATGAFTTTLNSTDTIPIDPSFCLMDIKDKTCTLYVYTLVDGEVKIDKLIYHQQQQQQQQQ